MKQEAKGFKKERGVEPNVEGRHPVPYLWSLKVRWTLRTWLSQCLPRILREVSRAWKERVRLLHEKVKDEE